MLTLGCGRHRADFSPRAAFVSQFGEKSKAQLKREKKAAKEAEELAAMEKEVRASPGAAAPPCG